MAPLPPFRPKSVFDTESTISAPLLLHCEILQMSNLHANTAATAATAFITVVEILQLPLYPCFQMLHEPLLSTHILTGTPWTMSGSEATHTSGPTNSSADILLDNFLPRYATPELIFLPHGK